MRGQFLDADFIFNVNFAIQTEFDKNKGFMVVRNKKLKISIPDNILFFYLIMIKLYTLNQLENIN